MPWNGFELEGKEGNSKCVKYHRADFTKWHVLAVE